ncbi:MAG: glycosyltransferase family 2 protein [Candidatus Buchananbacteria bacterium]|nr:glycosyltransferase family 2 protein [Candidatus Buchananbacteria bacterium]
MPEHEPKNPTVTIQIVTWNSRRYIGDCLKAVFAQTYRDFQVLVIDNNSADGTVELIQDQFPQVPIFKNNRNHGFARAHNQGLRSLHTPYVVLCNPDVLMTDTWLETMMQAVANERYQDVGSFGGKLLRLVMLNDEYHETEQTDIVDSCGLAVCRNQRVVELGAGKLSADFTTDIEVFGQSGALVAYRREALEAVMITDHSERPEYLDEYFFVYKEDVDLAWRLQLAGWRSQTIIDAEAYHVRAMQGSEIKSRKQLVAQKRSQSKITRLYSYRNQFLILMKDVPSKLYWKHFLAIAWYEFQKFGYVLLFEQSSLVGLVQALKLRRAMRRRRKAQYATAKIAPAELEKWFDQC